MSQIETRGQLGPSFVKGLAAKLFDIQNQADMAYSLGINDAKGVEANNMTDLFKQEKSDQARETIAGKTGVGYLELTNEGEDYKSDSRASTYETQFNFIKKTKTITITEEDMEDRIVNSKLSETRDLLVGGMMTKDKDAFSIFNFAFTAPASLPAHLTFYGDGVPMCSTLHPVKEVAGTTQSNASATSIPLTEQNLEIAKTALRRQTDDRGLPMNIGSGRLMLVVPDSLQKQAEIITQSKLRPNTGNNDINVYDGPSMSMLATKWINSQNGGSDTAWFLVDTMHSPLVFFDRRPLSLGTPYLTDSNKNVSYDISARYQVGNRDFRGIWGSKGDSTSYSS